MISINNKLTHHTLDEPTPYTHMYTSCGDQPRHSEDRAKLKDLVPRPEAVGAAELGDIKTKRGAGPGLLLDTLLKRLDER